jgi:hypothetical protein
MGAMAEGQSETIGLGRDDLRSVVDQSGLRGSPRIID